MSITSGSLSLQLPAQTVSWLFHFGSLQSRTTGIAELCNVVDIMVRVVMKIIVMTFSVVIVGFITIVIISTIFTIVTTVVTIWLLWFGFVGVHGHCNSMHRQSLPMQHQEFRQ